MTARCTNCHSSRTTFFFDGQEANFEIGRQPSSDGAVNLIIHHTPLSPGCPFMGVSKTVTCLDVSWLISQGDQHAAMRNQEPSMENRMRRGTATPRICRREKQEGLHLSLAYIFLAQLSNLHGFTKILTPEQANEVEVVDELG